MTGVEDIARKAQMAKGAIAQASTEQKNMALCAMGEALMDSVAVILDENSKDIEEGKKQGISTALLDRLTLNESRVREMAQGLFEVASLKDPVGEVVEGWKLPNGLVIEKVRVPIGVIGIIYEARPNVTVDAAGLCIKSGNAVILRGSSNAINSNAILVDIISRAVADNGLPEDSIQLIRSTDRESARELMRMHGLVDLLIPRGGEGLIRTVVENSTVPVIETGVGNCHVYVDGDADLDMALRIVVNAKTQRPGVCNACETLLVHQAIAEEFLPLAARKLREKGVSLRGCPVTKRILGDCEEATEEDWYREYLDLILAVKVVSDVNEAVGHINKYGSGHSEAIVTNSYENSRIFTERVDAAAVYVNASTRFTDGGQFGMGAEIGISTQKLHARGPMSLPELTTTKFIIRGSGQIRE